VTVGALPPWLTTSTTRAGFSPSPTVWLQFTDEAFPPRPPEVLSKVGVHTASACLASSRKKATQVTTVHFIKLLFIPELSIFMVKSA